MRKVCWSSGGGLSHEAPGVVQSELRCPIHGNGHAHTVVVYDTPSLQVKDALAAFSLVYIVAFGSFSR